MSVVALPLPRGPSRIDLSLKAPFRLGRLEVRPASREVSAGGPGIVAEPRVLQVLVALAEADGGTVSREHLVQRCWEGRAIGDDAIQRAVAKARRLADLTDPPAFMIESISRVGYRLLPASEDPAAKDNVIKTLRAAPWTALPGSIGEPLPRRTLLAAGAAVAGVGALGFAAWRTMRPGPAVASEPVVTVLPFDNLNADPNLNYLADGLSEDILNVLVRAGGLKVTARSSSFTFRGREKANAAAALKAAYVVDGSIMREGGRLRVNAHLSDVKTQQTLWSDSYDRDVSQSLLIEDEVAAQVAGALKLRLAPPGGDRRIAPEVFDLYLRARDDNRVFDLPTSLRIRAMLQEAVQREPGFAAAWFELAKNAFARISLEDLATQPVTAAEGLRAARRALELDPKNGTTWGIIALLHPMFGRWDEVETLMQRGLKLSPSDPLLLLYYAHVGTCTGRIRHAVESVQRALTLDPFNISAASSYTTMLTFARRFPEVMTELDRMQVIWPGGLSAYWGRVWCLFTAERFAEAADFMQHARSPPEGTDEIPILMRTFRTLASGTPAERRKAADDNLRLAQMGTGYAMNGMYVLARLGFTDDVLRVARSLYLRQGDFRLDRSHQFLGAGRYQHFDEPDACYLFHPFMQPLRRSGALDGIFSAIGLTDFWRNHPPDRI